MEYVDHWDGIIDGAITTFTHVDPPPTAALSYFDFSDAHGTAAIEIVLRDPYPVSGVTFDYGASGWPNSHIPGDGGAAVSASASYFDLATASWVAYFSDAAGGPDSVSIGGTRQLKDLAFVTNRLRFETSAGASSFAGNPMVSMGVTVRSITGVPEPGGALLLVLGAAAWSLPRFISRRRS